MKFSPRALERETRPSKAHEPDDADFRCFVGIDSAPCVAVLSVRRSGERTSIRYGSAGCFLDARS